VLSAFSVNRKIRLTLQLCVWTVLFCAVGAVGNGRSQIAQAEDLKEVQPVSQLSQQIDSPSISSVTPPFTSNAPLIQGVDDSEAAQVTSVSQLSDVQPTDWAFQALQSLVERYGCIAGYPDGTFRGNRAATRYELAAALNACLDQISDRFATKEDLATVKALQEEFKTELATLKGRVDGLEARSKTLEAQQFSTTTKFSGSAFFNITGATAGRGVKANGSNIIPGTLAAILPPSAFGQTNRVDPATGADKIDGVPRVRIVNDPNVTFSGLVWLNFDTSFTGQDRLHLQLTTGTGDSPANAFASAGLYNTWGTPFTDQTGGATNGLADVVIRELTYSFPVAKNVQIVAGPRINWYRYFNDNRFTFFLNGTSSFDSIGTPLENASKRGAGVVVLWSPSKQLQFHLGYLSQSIEFIPGSSQSAPNPAQGLFGGTNTLTAELTYSPIKTLNLRLLYSRTNLRTDNYGGAVDVVGGTDGLPLWGLADDGAGGSLKPATANTFGFNFDWLVAKHFGLFGRYTFGNTNLTPVNPAVPRGDVNNQSIQFGAAFPDLGKQGAQATLSFVVPSDVLSGRKFLISGGGDGGTQYDIEATYFYPINDNISLVPAFYTIINANNFSSNPTVFVGNLRMQFSF
jgi:Carbohydrate-selective porin, OprB family/S-layer homology domain